MAALDRFLATVARLDTETIRHLAALSEGEVPISVALARRAAARALGASGRRQVYEDARRALEQWTRPNVAHGPMVVMGVGFDPDQELRLRALPLLLDATLAIVVGDALGATDRAALVASWGEATEPPGPVDEQR